MQYTIELEVEKPREKVAELFADQDNLAYWQPGFVGIEHLSGEAGKPGAKSRLLYKNRGREVELIETVLVSNLPEQFTATFETKGMTIEVRNRFEEAGPDKTLWICDNDAKVSGVLMRLITLLMPGCLKKQTLTYNRAFKAFAEHGAGVRAAAT